jgi:hypothetical protein
MDDETREELTVLRELLAALLEEMRRATELLREIRDAIDG